MERKEIQSSNVKSLGYEDKVLEVEFHRGGIYQYSPITETAYNALMASDSKGKWIQANLVNNKTVTCKKL